MIQWIELSVHKSKRTNILYCFDFTCLDLLSLNLLSQTGHHLQHCDIFLIS